MREDFLHFVWQYKKIPFTHLRTEHQETLEIVEYGFPNLGEGPDFLNARISIGGQLWAGNVEMHLKSSDWYAHHHETDINYDNVVLHVVWEDDIAVFRKDQSQIPTLVLKNLISEKLLLSYQKLMNATKTKFINCEKVIDSVPSIIWTSWEERLYFERLEQKASQIEKLLTYSKHDWEAVLFALLSKNFGTKTNGPQFLDNALKLDFSKVRKTSSNLHQLESLLFGYFGLLGVENCHDQYFLGLKKEYAYLKQKYDLRSLEGKPAFFGMRPMNFPTLRISQLANLYYNNSALFQRLLEIKSLGEFYKIFQITTSPYWENHFTFGKLSKPSKKRLSKSFIDLLLINTIIPLKFSYARVMGKTWDDEVLALISNIKGETNSIVTGFHTFGISSKNALESQSKIQLYNTYCTSKRCLDCAVGVRLLNRNVYF